MQLRDLEKGKQYYSVARVENLIYAGHADARGFAICTRYNGDRAWVDPDELEPALSGDPEEDTAPEPLLAQLDRVSERVRNEDAEAVSHPAHYGGDTTYEVIKVAEAWGLDRDAYLFNLLKYIGRSGKKDGNPTLQDLRKGSFYLDRRIQQLEAGE